MGDVSMIAPVAGDASKPDPGESDALRIVREVEAKVLRLEKIVNRVARTQAKNLPIFKEVIARITTMRESIHDHANSLMRVEKMAQDSATVTAALSETVRVISETQKEANDKLDNILSLFTHAKTWSGYVSKYGGKVFTFVMGIAVAKGFLDADMVKQFLAIFS